MSDNNPGINPTAIFVTVAILVGIGITGSVLLSLFRPEASATFINNIVILLGVIVSFAGSAALTNNVAKKVEHVRQQTNGTLSARDAKIEELTRENNNLRAAKSIEHNGASNE